MPTIQINKAVGNGSSVQVLTVPAGVTHSSLNIVASNPLATGAEFQMHIGTGASAGAGDLVEPGAIIPAKGRYELSCRLLQAGEKVWFTAPAGVVVRAELLIGD